MLWWKKTVTEYLKYIIIIITIFIYLLVLKWWWVDQKHGAIQY